MSEEKSWFPSGMMNILAPTCRYMQRRYMDHVEPDQWPDWRKDNKIWLQPDGEWITQAGWVHDDDNPYTDRFFRGTSAYGGDNAEYPFNNRAYGQIDIWNLRLANPWRGDKALVNCSGQFEISQVGIGNSDTHMRETWDSLSDLKDSFLIDDERGEEWEYEYWRDMLELWHYATAGAYAGTELYDKWDEMYPDFNGGEGHNV